MKRLRSFALACAVSMMSCGKGLSLDPIEPTAGEKYDAADAQEADTTDAAAEDASFDGWDSREDDALDASVAVDQSADSDADSPEAPPDRSADAGGGADGGANGHADAAIDSDGSRDDAHDVESDEDAEDAPVDADVEAGDGCTVACGWPEADYYVDASVAVDGDGSKFSPFKTISRAIEAHHASPAQAKRAYVAAGLYDQALGEKFPLELRGLSLQGAGQKATFVVGTGILDHSGAGGSFYGQYSVTMVAGDRDLPTTIADLSVRPENPVPVLNHFGIFCDRGGATGEVAPPAGQTIVDRATVGPGFHASIIAGTSTTLAVTGCNLLVRSSVLTGGWAGVRANGCKSPGVSAPVLVEMGGDEPSKGNMISLMQAPGDGAAGASLEGCVIRSRFQNNSFVDSVYALRIERGVGSVGGVSEVVATIRDNTFERLTAGAVVVTGLGMRVDELSGNRFRQITRGVTQEGAPAIALSIDLRYLGKVRKNEFVGNDFGILLAVPQATSGQAPDFGTAADPGNNVFRCNSALRSTGADLAFQGTANPAATWSGNVHLAGNAWDHAGPTVLTDDPIPNGCDISTIRAPNVTLDLQNASLSTLACPTDRVPGR